MQPADQIIWDRWDANRHLTPDERLAAIDAADTIELAEDEHGAEFVQVGDHDAERRVA